MDELSSGTLIIILVLVLWELFWKGVALWRAAINNHQWWFVALMVINSVGILPIVYLKLFDHPVRNVR